MQLRTRKFGGDYLRYSRKPPEKWRVLQPSAISLRLGALVDVTRFGWLSLATVPSDSNFRGGLEAGALSQSRAETVAES